MSKEAYPTIPCTCGSSRTRWFGNGVEFLGFWLVCRDCLNETEVYESIKEAHNAWNSHNFKKEIAFDKIGYYRSKDGRLIYVFSVSPVSGKLYGHFIDKDHDYFWWPGGMLDYSARRSDECDLAEYLGETRPKKTVTQTIKGFANVYSSDAARFNAESATNDAYTIGTLYKDQALAMNRAVSTKAMYGIVPNMVVHKAVPVTVTFDIEVEEE